MTAHALRACIPTATGFAAQLLLALVSGALGVLAFAPFYFWPVALASLFILFSLWHQSPSIRRAFAIGFAWGLGTFTAGVSWIYVSLHVYGSMPLILAGLATVLFCAYLALYPALAGALFRVLQLRFRISPGVALPVLMPVCFVIFEYLRGWIVSGFPFLSIGYSQTPGGAIGAPLAGYAAIIGVYGISLLLALSVALLLWWMDANANAVSKAYRMATFISILGIWGIGALLLHVSWSEPVGNALRVALLQGNIEQSMKWREDQRAPTLAIYQRMISGSDAKLIVLPETALPDFLDRIPPEYLESLRQQAVKKGADILTGVPIAERPAGASQYHLANSAVSIGASPTQRYDKQHLVAFGEFVPPLFSWVYRWLKIPMSDFNTREIESRPMSIAGHKIAVNICYEDAFGREIASQLPDAELLVNISNMAWFGHSLASDQHVQMSQMRALETSRWMLRATNTGVTAAINEKGEIVKSLPQFARGALELDVQPRSGVPPFVRWKDGVVLGLLMLGLTGACFGRMQKH